MAASYTVAQGLTCFIFRFLRRPQGGRKPKLNEKQIREIKALLTDPTAQVTEVAKRYGVSRATIYKRVGLVNLVKITQAA
jgi:transposase